LFDGVLLAIFIINSRHARDRYSGATSISSEFNICHRIVSHILRKYDDDGY
jgi:hypothetical protein